VLQTVEMRRELLDTLRTRTRSVERDICPIAAVYTVGPTVVAVT